jgi:hypothetical protein
LVQQPANESLIIETDNLSSGADTVLHVQDMNGGFVAGNDDCWITNSGCSGWRSWVSLPAQPTMRWLRVVVRAYADPAVGSADLKVTVGSNAPSTQAFTFRSGYQIGLNSYVAQTHFYAVEEQGGATDTVMLVLKNDVHRAIAFDDDSGVGLMAMVDVAESCSSYCRIVVGAYAAYTEGRATFVWDQEVHTLDCDADGLGNALEAALGTEQCLADSDSDGLPDDVEVLGIDDWLDRLRFPYFGANPLQKDVFVEADWKECVPQSSSDWSCGDPASPDLDTWRLTGPMAEIVAGKYAPDVAVHIDNGVANSNASTWHKFGNWGGAKRMSVAQTGNKCDWLTPERSATFHGARVEGGSGGNSWMPGKCFDSGRNAQAFAHEMGHNFRLDHGGLQSASYNTLCKPNYRSLMTYALTYDPATKFSRAEFLSQPLNPTSMSEIQGLNTTDPALLAHLQTNGYDFLVDVSTGRVDWNRDGVYNTGNVRAATGWAWGAGGCDTTMFGANIQAEMGRTGNALTWAPMGETTPPRLYWFTRADWDGTVEYRWANNFPESCGSPPSPGCVTLWEPTLGTSATILSGSQGHGAPAAATAQNSNGQNRIVLVYKDVNNKLRFQSLTFTCGVFSCSQSWSAAAFVGTGSETIIGDPAAVEWQGNVHVYGIVDSGGVRRLMLWSYSPGGSWSGPTAQQTDTGAFIVPEYGIGVTKGFRITGRGPSQHLFAAIPLLSPLGQVEVAYLNASGAWVLFPSSR